MSDCAAKLIDRSGLDQLIRLLGEAGYQVIGPRKRDAAIVYAPIEGVDDLPAGWGVEQGAGHYRVQQRQDQALFGYAVGPDSAKSHLQPPRQTVFWVRRHGDELKYTEPEAPAPLAILGLRACDLAAIQIQDRVFLQGPYVDRPYEVRRDKALLISVNCNEPGGSCFCVSMDGGPRARDGFDLCLSELLDSSRHHFLIQSGSERGAGLLAQLDTRPATSADHAQLDSLMAAAEKRMGRDMDTDGIQALLRDNPEHPRWAEVAERCLACANCTMVCPSCFCHSIKDSSDLTGTQAERSREWDSCFSTDFSYVHGGAVRSSIRSRYRQWLTHKLSSWVDQFGSSGCVGCGRCISWCPVGIDLTEEVAAIRHSLGPNKKEVSQ